MAKVGDLSDDEWNDPEPVIGFPGISDPKPGFNAFLDELRGVEFWDYDRFNEELLSADLPELPIRLLEESRFIWMMNDVGPVGGFGVWGTLRTR